MHKLSILPVVKRFFKINSRGLPENTMSRQKFFENTFPDYTPENAKNLIVHKKVNPKCSIATSLNGKWAEVCDKFQYIERHDNTIYTGTAGFALLRYKKDPNSNENLKAIIELLSLDNLRLKRHTFLCGDLGPLVIGTLAYHKLGKKKEVENLIKKILVMQSDVMNTNTDLPNEYLYGRAGYLYGIMLLNKTIHPPPFEESLIRKIIEAILLCGRAESVNGKFKCPLMYQWHDSYYLGAAHGLSGILYLLLLLKEFLTEDEINTLIRPTIDYLITLKFPSGNYPSSLHRESDKYVQWCHGAPGFLYLFTTAYKVYKDTKYLKMAEECAEVIWKRGLLRKGYSICHGVAGNAYCFLELFQTTQDDKHLYRAIKFAEWCLNYTKEHEEYSPDRPLSLFEGIAGPMYLLLDIQDPMRARFPGFSL